MPGTTTISGTIRSGVKLTTADTTITQTGKVTSRHTAVTGPSSTVFTLTNAGTIEGGNAGVTLHGPHHRHHGVGGTGSTWGTHSDGVFLGGGGTVSNASTGVIFGEQTGVHIQGGPGTVINDGRITGHDGFGVDLAGGGTIVNAGTIAGAVYAAKFAAGYDNRLVLDPGQAMIGLVDGGNTIGSTHESTLELASGASTGILSGTYIHFEQIAIDTGASWDITGNHTLPAGYTVTNNGTLYDGGALTFGGNLVGKGTDIVLAGETFVDTGMIGAGQTIGFQSHSGQIDLNAAGFSGVVGPFETGDTISLTGVHNVVSYNVVNGDTLDLVRSDHSHIDLTFNQDYTTAQFSVVAAGCDTDITLNYVTCFAGGTRLDTEDGSIAVEDLQIGDLVLTASGQLRPVRWIGRRHLDMTRHPEPRKVQPIRIGAGALAAGLPRRDLLVSPDHAMLLDGMLIPARLLLNDATIRREERWQSVTYFHVELDSHDVLLAEGAAAESYLDTGNRNTFENAEGPMVLHPDLSDGQQRRETESCAPFAADAERVEPVWQRLSQRARKIGIASREPAATTTDADLQIEIDGTLFAPVAVEGRRHIFMLPKLHGGLVLHSRHAVPADRRPWIDDQRQLGVKVQRMTLSSMAGSRAIPIDHPDLGTGWWDTEHDGNVIARWTSGDAAIAITTDSPCRFEVEVGGTMDYTVAAELPEALTLCA